MLDLTGIPAVDNHCHPVFLNQHLDTLEFRNCFVEGNGPSFAERHIPNTVFYLWFLRQAADFYGCARTEEAVLAARNAMSAEALIERFLRAAHIDTLVIDTGYPASELGFPLERMGELGHCRIAKLLRLEILMQQLILAQGDFDEVIERFSSALNNIRTQGYHGFKSIVAYRTGLDVREWSKDEAAASFAEAREQAVRAGQLRIAHKPLLDYLLHIAFSKAAEQELSVQFHTGYGDRDTDMRLGNPLHLRNVIEKTEYQTMQIVLLHESYPYTQLGAYLAAIYPNVYFDLSYTIPFVEKLEMLAFTRQAISVAPASKLMYSSDSVRLPEMHWVGALRGRSVIGQVLDEMIDADEIDEEQALHIARLILRDTAYGVYKL
jgi:uncharacterized protein